jgi:hypothetical protein
MDLSSIERSKMMATCMFHVSHSMARDVCDPRLLAIRECPGSIGNVKKRNRQAGHGCKLVTPLLQGAPVLPGLVDFDIPNASLHLRVCSACALVFTRPKRRSRNVPETEIPDSGSFEDSHAPDLGAKNYPMRANVQETISPVPPDNGDAPSSTSYREFHTFILHNQHRAPTRDGELWKLFCHSNGFGHLWEHHFAMHSPSTSEVHRNRRVMESMQYLAGSTNQKITVFKKINANIARNYGGSARAQDLLHAAQSGTVCSSRTTRRDNVKVVNAFEHSISTCVEKIVREKSLIFIGVDDFTNIHTITRRDSTMESKVAKVAVVQMIVPPEGIGLAVPHDPVYQGKIDCRCFVDLFGFEFQTAGVSRFFHEDERLRHVVGCGIFGNPMDGVHKAQQRLMTHMYQRYQSDIFNTGRKLDHAVLIDVLPDNAYRSLDDFAEALEVFEKKLEKYLSKYCVVFVGDYPAIVNSLRYLRSSRSSLLLKNSIAAFGNNPLHDSLNFQQTITTLWHPMMHSIHSSLNGPRSRFPAIGSKLPSHRTSFLLECANGGYALIRSTVVSLIGAMEIRKRKDVQIVTLLWLLENVIPSALLYYSVIWLSKDIDAWRHAKRRLWIYFFCFGRKNYMKLPLAQEAMLHMYETNHTNLYSSLKKCMIWCDDFFNEQRMGCIRRGTRPESDGEDIRRIAILQQSYREVVAAATEAAGQSRNAIGETKLKEVKAKCATFMASVFEGIIKR